MYKYKFQICELAHAQIEEKRGVPAGICRSCIHDPKVVAQNTKIDQQIYLLMAGKGLKGIFFFKKKNQIITKVININ